MFVWFLLRCGYSTKARALGLGWVMFLLTVSLTAMLSSNRTAPPVPALQPSPVIAANAATGSADPGGQALSGAIPPSGKNGTPSEVGPSKSDCTPTSETEGWKYIKASAVRAADLYAFNRKPEAAFAGADGNVVWQMDGPHKGHYTLVIVNEQGALAELVPLFDFCTPASELDDRGTLWKVTMAELDGEKF